MFSVMKMKNSDMSKKILHTCNSTSWSKANVLSILQDRIYV